MVSATWEMISAIITRDGQICILGRELLQGSFHNAHQSDSLEEETVYALHGLGAQCSVTPSGGEEFKQLVCKV